jgi:hypothetical protein
MIPVDPMSGDGSLVCHAADSHCCGRRLDSTEARASTPTCAAKSRRELLRSPVTKAQLQGGRQSHPPPMAVALHQTWGLGSRLALSDFMQQVGALHMARESETIDSTGHFVG